MRSGFPRRHGEGVDLAGGVDAFGAGKQAFDFGSRGFGWHAVSYPVGAGRVNEDSARETLAYDQRAVVQPARLFVRGRVRQQLRDRLLDVGDADRLLEVGVAASLQRILMIGLLAIR